MKNANLFLKEAIDELDEREQFEKEVEFVGKVRQLTHPLWTKLLTVERFFSEENECPNHLEGVATDYSEEADAALEQFAEDANDLVEELKKVVPQLVEEVTAFKMEARNKANHFANIEGKELTIDDFLN